MLFICGCTLLNPYESSFSCPETGNGRCVSVDEAYRESAAGLAGSDAGPAGIGPTGPGLETPARVSPGYDRYRTALFEKFSGLLQEPVTPLVSPPKTMRVLLLPYRGRDNELYMLRYVYFFVDEPRWLLGDAVSAGEEE
jgi:conjugal transfer pilus assembly protein TraV